MLPKILPVIVLGTVGLLIGVWLYPTHGEDPVRSPVKRLSRGWEESDLWPASRSWVWNVDPVATKAKVGICVRTNESKIEPGTSPTFPAEPKVPAKGNERHSGWSLIGEQRLAGRLTCQMIDFREIGLEEAAGKQPLRLLVRLRVAGSLLSISGTKAIVLGETLAGTVEAEPKWNDDEMHLLTVYTQTADTLFAHYVLIQQRAGE